VSISIVVHELIKNVHQRSNLVKNKPTCQGFTIKDFNFAGYWWTKMR